MTGFDLATLRVDKEKEVDGVWMDMGDDCKLLIARWRNPKYQDRFNRLHSRSLTRMRSSEALVETNQQITRECIAHHCLLGWKNLLLDGKAVAPYTPEVALDLFKKFPDFLEFVMGYAQEREAYRSEEIEDAKGNSDGSSSGK